MTAWWWLGFCGVVVALIGAMAAGAALDARDERRRQRR